MESSRRSFLRIAGVSLLSAGIRPVFDASAFSGEQERAPEALEDGKALSAHRWAMVVDSRQYGAIEDIEPMMTACHALHNVPTLTNEKHEIKWIWPEKFKHAFPIEEHAFVPENVKDTYFPVLCNHCENPPCVRVCPTQATFKRRDGIVAMDFHRCIGCRFCMAACPYGSRSFNFRDPRPFITHTNPQFPTRMMGVVEKCNFCAERLAVGKMPACVEASKGTLTFGDLEDPGSGVRKLLGIHYTIRRKQGLGTGPQIYYIV
jgi:molybdopterin-containing oxidoreductase family iron-sulfur binding subunit